MYNLLYKQLEEILKEEDYLISRMSNMSAFLNENIKDLNWVGFYIVKDNVLKVGPFQGLVACSNIPKGKGVCGSAWERLETIVVKDVHEFPGHIACDSKSNSEVVIPIIRNGKMIAELDVDSPLINRFDEELVKFLEKCVDLI